MIWLALLLVLSIAIDWPIWRMLTAEDRRSRLRAPDAYDAPLPLLQSHSHIGLT